MASLAIRVLLCSGVLVESCRGSGRHRSQQEPDYRFPSWIFRQVGRRGICAARHGLEASIYRTCLPPVLDPDTDLGPGGVSGSIA